MVKAVWFGGRLAVLALRLARVSVGLSCCKACNSAAFSGSFRIRWQDKFSFFPSVRKGNSWQVKKDGR